MTGAVLAATETFTASAFDRHMMAIALAMARRGLGTTAFNPSVGAVIADETTGEVIARGWTQPGGRPHAEKEALRRAGARAHGKTMYVTLEPCAQTGRVPTCADAMLTAGLARVVSAIADPNLVIAGRGFAQLRAAGVRVDIGVAAEEARRVTAGHILHVTRQRPFVQLKLAVSADGRMAAGNGRPVWVTGPVARAHGHLLRAEADAILCGIGTVLTDNPDLTCRLPGMAARSPLRCVLDTNGRLDAAARVLAGDVPTIVYSGVETPVAGQIRTITVGRSSDGVDLEAVLADLDARQVRRVLIEGGPRLAAAFLAQDLVDEVVVFRGGAAIGPEGFEPLGSGGLKRFAEPQWVTTGTTDVGGDTLTRYWRTRAGVP